MTVFSQNEGLLGKLPRYPFYRTGALQLYGALVDFGEESGYWCRRRGQQ
jgi:hypothetical protein